MAMCAQCKHFRRVKPPSQLLAVAIGAIDAAISNALTKMGEDEQKQKEEEAAYKKQQALSDRRDAAWATRPVMSEYCGLHEANEEYLIAEVKNRDLRCSEFEAGWPELHRCVDCPFRVAATGIATDAKWEKTFADSSLMDTAVGTSTSTSDNLLNKYREGIGPRKAFEITGAYQSKGIMTIKPVYLDYCSRLSNEDGNEFVVCILQNSHQTCQYWPRGGGIVAQMVAENSRNHAPMPPEAQPPATAEMPSPATAQSAAKRSVGSRSKPGRDSRQTAGNVASTISSAIPQEQQAPAEAPQPVQEPDPSMVTLVPGNPPLTQELVDLVAASWEWALDIKLDAQGRAILQQECVRDWQGNNRREAIEGMADVIKTFEFLKQADESARLILHEQIWASVINAMQNVRSNFNDWVAKAYYAASPPLAPGHPPLTRKMCDASIEALNFLVYVDIGGLPWEKYLSTPRRARDSWAGNLASTYAKLPADQQQFYAQMPALWAVLCESWRNASQDERDGLIAQWHQQFPWWTRDWSDDFRSQMMEEHAKADATSFFNDPNEPDPYEPSPFIPSLRSGPPGMPPVDASAPASGAPVTGMSPGTPSRATEDPLSEVLRKISEEAAQDEGKLAETPEEAMELQNRAERRKASMQFLSNMSQLRHETLMAAIGRRG